ncbi:MAG: succinate dehydrogenase [Rhodospirillaceae bacterium]|nr:succinate dehydrogenase [Rhodospirillaceae bacterium]MBT6140025.1 succinate dehydrogenase [Rhodospirillaceae bacterium]
MEARLYLLQRATALLLAPLVVVHLVVILLAVRGGLSAAEILARTQGSTVWAAFYGVFVIAVALHAPIGLRNLLGEWLGWRDGSRDLAVLVFGLALLGLGLRAVWGVTT